MNLKSNSHRTLILLCFDANYAECAAVATYSAHKNTKSPLFFYWMVPADIKERAEKLKKHLEKFGVEIELHLVDFLEVRDWKISHHFTTAIFLRLFAPDLLLSVDKVIYIDCDTLVLTDLSDLYNLPLSDSYFAGVVDEVGARTSKVPRNSSDVYINSGVLLMDLKSLRNDGFLQRLKVLYTEYETQLVWVDQCLINKYAEGKKVILDPKWNRQIFTNQINEINFLKLANKETSSILHFVGPTKPWQKWSNPIISNFWWEYAQDLQIENFKPTQIKTVEQLISFADVLHLNACFEEASTVKTKVIQALNDFIKKMPSKAD